GAVNVHAGEGNIDLSKGNISAKGNITLKADNGSITILGTNATATANITSKAGNISIDAVGNRRGVRISQGGFTAGGGVYINATVSSGVYDASYSSLQDVGLYLNGDVKFSATSGTIINANNLRNSKAYSPPTAMGIDGGNITFDGGGVINATSSFSGIVVSQNAYGGSTKSSLSTENGDLTINAILNGMATSGPTGAAGAASSGAFVFQNQYTTVPVSLNVISGVGSNISIYANSSANKSGPFAAFAAAIPESTAAGHNHNGFVFSGGGNVSVIGSSDSGDAVNLRLFNNENLSGNLSITGVSNSGVGVNFDKYLSTKVSNATITGRSVSGVGVQMTAINGSADLNGNSVFGSTTTGKGGVILSGNNITLTNGTLNGTVRSGNGSGVLLTGGSNYTLDGASVTGTAVDGSGITINGSLTVNNGTSVEGHATASGNGVTVSGNLTTDIGDGISIVGTASSGDGIKVDGDATLTNALLNGSADSGVGANIAGNLTTDSATQVSGHAASGTGVRLGAGLTGATVKGSSDTGTGLQLADNAVVTEAVLSGTSASGDGVAFT
ncbi:hypothetical protein R3G49_004985, partial [Salmonella enterica]|nr:hypothetical protein [Salmonella enterica]